MKINGAKASMALVCLILGIMLSLQFRTNMHSSNYVSYNQWTKQQAVMKDLKQKHDELVKEVVALRARLTRAASGDVNKDLKQQLTKANIAAGLTPVSGAGIVIVLEDNPDPVGLGRDPNDYLIHDSNLLFVLNQLKSAGAKAISINDERITAGSETRCAGPTILVNLNRVSPPFEIKAIGDPDILNTLMRAQGGELETMRLKGIKISIQKDDNIEIPAYNAILKYRYAKPLES